MHALEIKNLIKTYATGVQAVKGIDLTVEQGDFYALLGHNGAGKSTTIGIISSLVNKTSGSVKVFGYDLDTQKTQLKQQIGLVPQEFNFNQFEKVVDVWRKSKCAGEQEEQQQIYFPHVTNSVFVCLQI